MAVDGFAAVDFGFAREVLQRGIAALYLVAFVSTLNQFRPLLGEHGLLPAPVLLDWVTQKRERRKLLHPTLFTRVRYTDRRLVALSWAGIVVAALLVVGVPQLGPPWAPMLAFLALWFGYMSVVSVGQTFYSFGWEMLLLEAGFLAAFLGSNDQPPPTVVIVLFWWLLFRLEFGAGMIKIRGGREWRDLTAMTFHHETQPMPGPLSRQAHLLPRWFHKLEVVGNHIAQLVVPFFLFAPILTLWLPDSAGWVSEPVEGAAWVGAVAGDRDRDAAVARAHRELRVAELGHDRARVLRDRPPRHRDSGADAGDLAAVDGVGHAAVVGRADLGGRCALRRAERARGAQPLRATAAHERELQPLAARQRLRSLRHGHAGAGRDRRRGVGRRGGPALARVRVPGKPGTCGGSRGSSLRIICGWTG